MYVANYFTSDMMEIRSATLIGKSPMRIVKNEIMLSCLKLAIKEGHLPPRKPRFLYAWSVGEDVAQYFSFSKHPKYIYKFAYIGYDGSGVALEVFTNKHDVTEHAKKYWVDDLKEVKSQLKQKKAKYETEISPLTKLMESIKSALENT